MRETFHVLRCRQLHAILAFQRDVSTLEQAVTVRDPDLFDGVPEYRRKQVSRYPDQPHRPQVRDQLRRRDRDRCTDEVENKVPLRCSIVQSGATESEDVQLLQLR